MKQLSVAVACLCLVLAGAPACGPRGAPLTPAEVQTNGSHTFAAPMPKVFAATKAALELQGYEVAIANPQKGLLKTKPKVVRADAVATQNVAMAVAIGRQYEIELKADGAGTTVTATPHIYVGEAEVEGSQPVWQLDGPGGERTLWKRLFDDIEASL